jgi:Mg2+ and Co2+ transporters
MLSVFVARPQGLVRIEGPPDATLLKEALWFDLLEPTPEEEKQVEDALGVDVPTREEMREIEASNRFYEEDNALFLTATIVTKLDTDLPESTQVTFILAGGKLVTNRYTDPLPFRRFLSYAQTHPSVCASAVMVLVGLLESIVNRIADVIERVGSDLDSISADVFAPTRRRRAAPRDFRAVLGRVGQSGELVSKARESLVSLGRLLVFLQQTANGPVTQDARTRLRTISRDVLAMSDHASFLGDKVMFALDATLGMVTIDQNNILKIFSVVTLFLLPPTVIGTFYGMNFDHLPWLHESWGAWTALGMMAVTAVVPYFVFKRKGWL